MIFLFKQRVKVENVPHFTSREEREDGEDREDREDREEREERE